MTKRILLSLAGFSIFAVGLAILLNIQIALHPIDNIVAAIDHIINDIIFKNSNLTIPYPVSIVLLHSVFVITSLIMKKQLKFSYRELFLGYAGIALTSLILALVQKVIPQAGHMVEDGSVQSYFVFIVGFLLLSFGIYLYTIQSLVNPPIDMFFFYLKDFLRIPFSLMRAILDMSALVIAFVAWLAFGSDVVFLNVFSLLMVIFLGQTFKVWALIPWIHPDNKQQK